MSRRWQHAKDGNHHMLVNELLKMGHGWWDTSQTNLGVDGLAIVHGILRPVEIKDPSRLTKACKADPYLALTAHEKKVHQMLKAHHIRVEILTDLESLGVFREPIRTMERYW